MNSNSMQERNQNTHTYFEDKEKKRKEQPINFKFVTTIMEITRRRLSEALYKDMFSGQSCLYAAQNCFYRYLEIEILHLY
jgi:hypothetical protein